MSLRRNLRTTTGAVVAAGAILGGALAGTATAGEPLERLCEPYASITLGKYWLNNNLWGQDSGTGQQCVADDSHSGDTIGWTTDWEWSGEPNQVKSFVSSVLGWHWGWKNQNTGLPIQLSSGTRVNSQWSFQPDASGTYNVAYDLWLHEKANPGSTDDPTDEVMIWLNTAGGAGPVGSKIATVDIGGASWDLYQGNVGWNVYSFVRTENATSSELDLTAFTDDLVARGLLSEAKYLSSVQAGTEVFTGSGTLTTTSYNTTVG